MSLKDITCWMDPNVKIHGPGENINWKPAKCLTSAVWVKQIKWISLRSIIIQCFCAEVQQRRRQTKAEICTTKTVTLDDIHLIV